jgi:hypothetical protein
MTGQDKQDALFFSSLSINPNPTQPTPTHLRRCFVWTGYVFRALLALPLPQRACMSDDLERVCMR